MSRPRLALVPGEPAGIGPELCVRALHASHDADLVVIGDRDTVEQTAKQLGTPLRFTATDVASCAAGEVQFIDVENAMTPQCGVGNPANAIAVISALKCAAERCQQHRLDGLVTGPVHKATINAGGIAYSGTTELLAQIAQCEVVMMLANDVLRVALATTHLPLQAVSSALTPVALERSLRILHAALQTDFQIASPRIAVLGLNPHAGENGYLGREEIDVIAPVIDRLRAEGYGLQGPMPADTAFLPVKRRAYDAVLAMYHDQGLPVLKFSGFEQAVNVTLGLPYPRVAVDHGTAFDLAGKGIADPTSLFSAIAMCARLSINRRQR